MPGSTAELKPGLDAGSNRSPSSDPDEDLVQQGDPRPRDSPPPLYSPVELELRAQVRRFIELTGHLPHHMDGHQHVHVLPDVREVFAQVLSDVRIPFTRVPMEPGLHSCPWVPAHLHTFYMEVEKDALDSIPVFKHHGIRRMNSLASKVASMAVASSDTEPPGKRGSPSCPANPGDLPPMSMQYCRISSTPRSLPLRSSLSLRRPHPQRWESPTPRPQALLSKWKACWWEVFCPPEHNWTSITCAEVFLHGLSKLLSCPSICLSNHPSCMLLGLSVPIDCYWSPTGQKRPIGLFQPDSICHIWCPPAQSKIAATNSSDKQPRQWRRGIMILSDSMSPIYPGTC
ncbi:hypothetical protein CCH79_00019360 [Gambusia affinis]|uniref:Carbohydrate deacetylase n=1 Tax=Gambusia affinis TaxID=33528 RepID=A0A315UWR1_GAMAF|nr:hypothetical protein CCH79_00019360 [Gambusia affinis]